MASSRWQFLSALPFLATLASATQWTVTSYYAVEQTTETDPYWSYIYTDTESWGLKAGVTPTYKSAVAKSTSTNIYDDVKIVEIYLDRSDVDSDDIATTTYDEYGGYDDDGPTTFYYQPIVYTAPSSCPTAFTVETYTSVFVPDEVQGQLSATSLTTGSDSYGTWVTAYLDEGAVPVTTATEDFVYSYYIADCINPTVTGSLYGGNDDDDSASNGGDIGSTWSYCMDDSVCSHLAIYAIVLAALIPALFLLGFLENYFWFRRMMVGKFSLRFGTALWIFLLWPVLCFTKQCPARDPDTQAALKQQWKNVSFGKALGLWFKHGFRHRYPVELLGNHPLYQNSRPNQPNPAGQMPGGPPPGGYVYYAPDGAPLDGHQYPPQAYFAAPSPEDSKGQPEVHQMGLPPPGMVMYYPQYPPQEHLSPESPQQVQQVQQSRTAPEPNPSPDSGHIAAATPVSPQPAITSQPQSPPQELVPQPGQEKNGTPDQTAGPRSS